MEKDEGATRWAPWVAAVILISVAAAGLASYVTARREPDDSPTSAAPEIERGTACKALQGAAAALEEEDAAATEHLLIQARKRAVQSLNTDGVLFGKPERLAIRLSSLATENSDSNPSLRSGLTAAAQACEELNAS